MARWRWKSCPPEAAAGVAASFCADARGRYASPGGAGARRGSLRAMEPEAASIILAAMAPDDRVDVLRQCTRKLHDTLVQDMAPAEAAETRKLSNIRPSLGRRDHDHGSHRPAQELTVEQAVAELRQIHQKSGQLVLCVRRGRSAPACRRAVDAQPGAGGNRTTCSKQS